MIFVVKNKIIISTLIFFSLLTYYVNQSCKNSMAHILTDLKGFLSLRFAMPVNKNTLETSIRQVESVMLFFMTLLT